MMRRGNVSFKPMLKTRNGSAVVENPRPVTPFTKAARKNTAATESNIFGSNIVCLFRNGTSER